MLTQHLREMEEDGLIIRTDLSGKVPHVEYSLSEPLGLPVVHLIDFSTRWGEQHSVPSNVKLYPDIEPPLEVLSRSDVTN
jgi:DNA-binding HxlR family transcriptional regulator